MNGGYTILKSNPVRVFWAGFETDTFRLQKSGWDLSANQDVLNRCMTIAGKHASGATFVTRPLAWEYFDIGSGRGRLMLDHHGWSGQPYTEAIVGGVVRVFEDRRSLSVFHPDGGAVNRANYPMMYSSSFSPIDAVPQMLHVERDYGRNLEDLVHFAPRIPQLILPEDTVGDLLDKALNLQADRRREILIKKTIGIF